MGHSFSRFPHKTRKRKERQERKLWIRRGATPRCFCVSKIHGFLVYNLRWGDEIMKNCGISSTPPCVGSRQKIRHKIKYTFFFFIDYKTFYMNPHIRNKKNTFLCFFTLEYLTSSPHYNQLSKLMGVLHPPTPPPLTHIIKTEASKLGSHFSNNRRRSDTIFMILHRL